MSINKPALACALVAALLAAVTVAGEPPVGLALTCVLALTAAGAMLAAPRRPSAVYGALALALAIQPALWDAEWVAAIDVVAAVVATSAAVVHPRRWMDVGATLVEPLRFDAGTIVVWRGLAAFRPRTREGQLAPLARGAALAIALAATFVALFASADTAFAEVMDGLVEVDADVDDLIWRAMVGLFFAALAGALCRAGLLPVPLGPRRAPRWSPRRAELALPLGAVVAVFAAFVAVQLRVLFGGAEYVRQTTDLGYGEYAREGFVQLLVVAALTVAVIAVAARGARDRGLRALLGALCVLTLVVLMSAFHRLDLVTDAYGMTRVRYTGYAIVAWVTMVFVMILAAGARPPFARRLPQVVTTLSLAGALAFTLTVPDRRIAEVAVDRAHDGKPVDTEYLSGLSTDALSALDQLPAADRARATRPIRSRLFSEGDGLAGANLSRALAR